jgi:hypothetical protein
LALLLATASGFGAEKAKMLRWKFRAGEALHVRLAQTTATETVVKERPVSMRVEMGLDMTWRIERVDRDGTGHLTASFTRFAVTSTGPDGKSVAFDSAAVEPPAAEARELARTVTPLLASRFQVALSARGEIKDVVLAAETESRLRDAPALSGWRDLLTKTGLNRTLRQSLGLLPARPVAVGNAWKDVYEIDSPAGQIRLTSAYTYRGSRTVSGRPGERLEVTTEVASRADGSGPEESRPIRQQYSGTLLFDAVAGHLAESELHQTIRSETVYRDKKIQVQASNTVRLTMTRSAVEEAKRE